MLTADYAATYGPLAPGATAVLRFRATIAPSLAIGTRITNTGVVTWNNPPQTARASVSIDVGGMVGVGVLNGKAWHDANFNTISDSNERVLEGWTVQLYRNDVLLRSAVTDAGGVYRIAGIAPNYATADRYELRFLAPGAGATTAKLGRAHSIFTNDLQRITDIVVQSGSNLQDLNLPINPNGVVYNTIVRTPIAGATLTLLHGGAPRAGCVLLRSGAAGPGHARRWLLPIRPQLLRSACPSGGDYLLGDQCAAGRLHRGSVADHSADQRRDHCRVLRAHVPGERRRRDRGDRAALRGPDFGVRAAADGARAHRRDALSRALRCSTTARCRVRARSSTTTFRSTRICRACCR